MSIAMRTKKRIHMPIDTLVADPTFAEYRNELLHAMCTYYFMAFYTLGTRSKYLHKMKCIRRPLAISYQTKSV